jgi:hypothetical protein
MFDLESFFAQRRCAGTYGSHRAVLVGAALLVAAAGVPGVAQAQTAPDALQFSQRAPAVGSARVLGRGGTGRAGFAETNALYYNPAGLGWMEASVASGGLAIVGTRDEARYQVGTLDPTQQGESVNNFGGHLALAYKFPTQRGSLVFAGAYNQVNTFGRAFSFTGLNSSNSITDTFLPAERDQYRLGENGLPLLPDSDLSFAAYEAGAIDYDADYDEDGRYPFFQAVPPGAPIEQRGTVTQDGRLQEVSFGAGVEAAPDVMLGGSANFSFGTYRYENAYAEADVNDEIGPDDYFLATNPELEGFQRLTFEERFTANLSGVNLRGGVSAEALPGVRLGTTVETPTFYQVDEEFTQAEITTVFDQGDEDGNSLTYGNRSDDVGVGESQYRVRTPWRLGTGAQVNLLPITGGVLDLTLTADVEFLDWSQLALDSDAVDLDGPDSPDVFADENFQAVVNTNLGAELRIGGAALRAGFASRPDPVEGEFELYSGEATDAGRETYSLGAGYRFAENVRVDVAWMSTRYDQQYRPYASLDAVPPGSDSITAPYIDQGVTRNRFFAGVRYFF